MRYSDCERVGLKGRRDGKREKLRTIEKRKMHTNLEVQARVHKEKRVSNYPDTC